MTPGSFAANNKERGHQLALFAWANMAFQFGLQASLQEASYKTHGHAAKMLAIHNDKIPDLEWLHAIHNQGHGDAIRGARAKQEGVKTGVSDIMLPVVKRWNGTIVKCGLYIEMKKPKGSHTYDSQKEFVNYAIAQGYHAVFAFSWIEARNQLLTYLGVPYHG